MQNPQTVDGGLHLLSNLVNQMTVALCVDAKLLFDEN